MINLSKINLAHQEPLGGNVHVFTSGKLEQLQAWNFTGTIVPESYKYF
jgi:hypothetical protein